MGKVSYNGGSCQAAVKIIQFFKTFPLRLINVKSFVLFPGGELPRFVFPVFFSAGVARGEQTEIRTVYDKGSVKRFNNVSVI